VYEAINLGMLRQPGSEEPLKIQHLHKKLFDNSQQGGRENRDTVLTAVYVDKQQKARYMATLCSEYIDNAEEAIQLVDSIESTIAVRPEDTYVVMRRPKKFVPVSL